jgi:YHS domain-containing protein
LQVPARSDTILPRSIKVVEDVMAEHRAVAPNEDPVCGMTVDIEDAHKKGLATTYEGREYVFCGKGCFLEFRDNPEAFLASDHAPSM